MQPRGLVTSSSPSNGPVDWISLVRPFVNIGLLRTGPQILPASRFLLGLMLFAFALVSAVAYGMRYDLRVVSAAVVGEDPSLFGFDFEPMELGASVTEDVEVEVVEASPF